MRKLLFGIFATGMVNFCSAQTIKKVDEKIVVAKSVIQQTKPAKPVNEVVVVRRPATKVIRKDVKIRVAKPVITKQ